MKIIRKKEYITELKNILRYISKDSKNRAINFRNELDSKIALLVDFPFKYRKSLHFDSENVRDLIYKGYTIVYRVNKQQNSIEIIEIFKWTK